MIWTLTLVWSEQMIPCHWIVGDVWTKSCQVSTWHTNEKLYCPVTLNSFYRHAWNPFGSPQGWKAAAAESVWLRIAEKKNQPDEEDEERVWSLQLPGDVVEKLSAGWIPAGGGFLQHWHSHWVSGQSWNKSCWKKEKRRLRWFILAKQSASPTCGRKW